MEAKYANHRLCECCWFASPYGRLPNGEYRQPVQVRDSAPGVCCLCGGVVITGIWVRALQVDMQCGAFPHDD